MKKAEGLNTACSKQRSKDKKTEKMLNIIYIQTPIVAILLI